MIKISNRDNMKKVLLKTIELLKEPDFGKKSSYQAIQQQWKAIIEQNKKDIEKLYYKGIIDDWAKVRSKRENDFAFEDEIISLLVNWLENIDWTNKEEVKTLYRYTELISNSDFANCYQAVHKYHKRILASIKKLIEIEDYIIEEKFHGGSFGTLVDNVINLYFYHTSHSWSNKNHDNKYELDRQEIAEIIPDFIKAFPQSCSNLTMYLLENNISDLVSVCSDLLYFYIKNKVLNHYSFTSKFFSVYQSASDTIYKKTPTILKATLQNKLTEDEIEYLVEDVLFMHLGIDSLESRIKSKENRISRLKLSNEEKMLKMAEKEEKELVEYIENFNEEYEKDWTKAIRRLAVSRSIYKSVELVIKMYPNHPKTEKLAKLFDESKEYKDKPKVYNLNQKPKIIFKDLHFKFLVIEELMYNQKILQPIFDIRKFASEYSKREIDVEDEGYEIIPEVKKYFKNLDISEELLKKVTTLYQDSGIGGGSEFICQMQPFWDPGAGDSVFKVSAKAIDDLEFLPNLKKITGLENSKPNKKLLQALKDKNIVLEDE